MAKKTMDRARKMELKAMGLGEEIQFTAMNSDNLSLLKALSYYNQVHDHDKSKEWALEWVKENEPSLYPKLKGLKSWRFGSRGFFCRIIELGYCPSPKEIAQTKSYFVDLATTIEKVIIDDNEQDNKTQPKVKVEEQVIIPSNAPTENVLINQIQESIDDLILGNKAQVLSFTNITKTKANEAIKFCESQLKQTVEDKDGFLSPSVFKMVKDAYTGFIETIGAFVKTKAKEPKKQVGRRSKDVVPKAAKGLDYGQIKLKQKAFIIDPRTNTVIVYMAEEGNNLDIQGVKILNYASSSFKKRLPQREFEIVENTKSIKKIELAIEKARTKVSSLVPKRIKPEEHILVATL